MPPISFVFKPKSTRAHEELSKPGNQTRRERAQSDTGIQKTPFLSIFALTSLPTPLTLRLCHTLGDPTSASSSTSRPAGKNRFLPHNLLVCLKKPLTRGSFVWSPLKIFTLNPL